MTTTRDHVIRVIGGMSRFVPRGVVDWIYANQMVSCTLRKALNLVAADGLTDVVIENGPSRGMRMRLNLQREKYFWLGTYEPLLQRAVTDFARPGMVAYDVGAHIGYWSLAFARVVGPTGCVFPFEPLPANLERLRVNIELNGLEDRVHPVPMAVHDDITEVTFLVHEFAAMGKVSGSGGRELAYPVEIRVSATTLDAFVYKESNPQPDLLKMDIEGGEVMAIPGMKRVLSEARPVCLWELHGPEAKDIALSSLVGHGYDMRRMEQGYPRISNSAGLPWKAFVVALPPDSSRV